MVRNSQDAAKSTTCRRAVIYDVALGQQTVVLREKQRDEAEAMAAAVAAT